MSPVLVSVVVSRGVVLFRERVSAAADRRPAAVAA
jgi:hypothetical protein